jgi:hypothetical protein
MLYCRSVQVMRLVVLRSARRVTGTEEIWAGQGDFGQAALCQPASGADQSSSGVISTGRPSPHRYFLRIKSRRLQKPASFRSSSTRTAGANRRFSTLIFHVDIPFQMFCIQHLAVAAYEFAEVPS